MRKSKTNAMAIAEAGEFYDEHDLFEAGAAVEIADIEFYLTKKQL